MYQENSDKLYEIICDKCQQKLDNDGLCAWRSRRYRWMSLQDLQSDATASTIHADVITMIKNAEKRIEQL